MGQYPADGTRPPTWRRSVRTLVISDRCPPHLGSNPTPVIPLPSIATAQRHLGGRGPPYDSGSSVSELPCHRRTELFGPPRIAGGVPRGPSGIRGFGTRTPV